MAIVNWDDAPEGAEFYAHGRFRRKPKWGSRPMVFGDCDKWKRGAFDCDECLSAHDYEPRPTISVTSTEWPEETRIDRIGRDRTSDDMGHYNRNADEALGAELSVYAKPTHPKTAVEFLNACAAVQSERGKQYDASGTGERSFAAAASAFNAATGKSLTGSDVCLLLTMVKLVRQYSSPDRLHHDSLLDGVSYLSLWAEELTKELQGEK
jgi:hypothetical protein